MSKPESGYAKLKIFVYRETIDASTPNYVKSKVMTGIIYIPIEYYEQINITDFESNKKLFQYLDSILNTTSDDYRRYSFLQLQFVAELPRGKKPFSFYIGRKGESKLIDSLETVKPYEGGWRDKLVIHGNPAEFAEIFGGNAK